MAVLIIMSAVFGVEDTGTGTGITDMRTMDMTTIPLASAEPAAAELRGCPMAADLTAAVEGAEVMAEGAGVMEGAAEGVMADKIQVTELL